MALWSTIRKNAHAAIIKVTAPYALRSVGGRLTRGVHEGTLAYAGAHNAKELEAIKRIASSGTPTIVYLMYMDRPAVLSEFIDEVRAVLAHFSSSDNTILPTSCSAAPSRRSVPFNLPRDSASVAKQCQCAPRPGKSSLPIRIWPILRNGNPAVGQSNLV